MTFTLNSDEYIKGIINNKSHTPALFWNFKLKNLGEK